MLFLKSDQERPEHDCFVLFLFGFVSYALICFKSKFLEGAMRSKVPIMVSFSSNIYKTMQVNLAFFFFKFRTLVALERRLMHDARTFYNRGHNRGQTL